MRRGRLRKADFGFRNEEEEEEEDCGRRISDFGFEVATTDCQRYLGIDWSAIRNPKSEFRNH
jgi:hypothetical protein